jgi:hypothetical protein
MSYDIIILFSTFKGSDFVSELLADGYADMKLDNIIRGVVVDKITYSPLNMKSKKINKYTFYYLPNEIILDNEIIEFLKNFRIDDGEDCFTLTKDEKGLVIY